MEHRIRLSVGIAAVTMAAVVGVSVITSTAVASHAYQKRGKQSLERGQSITVKGSTRKRIMSDRAVWRISVYGEAPLLPDAFERLRAATERVAAFLRDHGFATECIRLTSIDTETHYARDAKAMPTREVASYTLGRSFVVTTEDVARVRDAAGSVTELIRDDVYVLSGLPEFYYTRLADLKIQLMGLASQDARARAENIAQNVGCDVGEVQSAHMGVLQVTQPFSTEVSSYGIYDTSTIEKDVSAVVTVTFGVRSGN